MTTYVGQIRGNDGVYDVIVKPTNYKRIPSKVEVKYRKSKWSMPTALGEAIRSDFLEDSDDFGRDSQGGPWKTTTLVPNGTGKDKLEQKVKNFLNSTRK